MYTDDTNHCNIKLDLFIVIVIRRGCSKYIPTFIINYNLTPSKLIILSKEISSPALLFIVNLGLKFAWAVIISVSESRGLDQSSVLLAVAHLALTIPDLGPGAAHTVTVPVLTSHVHLPSVERTVNHHPK